MKKYFPQKGQAGQMTTEMILILAALLLMTFLAASQFKDDELIKNFVNGPWRKLAGLLQNGSWSEPRTSMETHPTQHGRHSSLKGEDG